MGHSSHLWTVFGTDADPVRDRPSRLSRGAGDEGRTVLEAVIALSIIAATAAAWVQMTTTASRAKVSADRHEHAALLASSELEILRATPDIEAGTDGSGGASQFDGLTILTDGAGPDHSETIAVNGHDYGVERFVLDPGSESWRRLVVVVSWTDTTGPRDVRVDTAIPIVPDAVTVGIGNLLLNGGFEFSTGGPSAGNYGNFTVEGWTGLGSTIEVWSTGFQGVPSTEGDTFVELNGSFPDTISQTVTVVPGTTYRWSIDHRGRSNDDTLEVLIDSTVVATFTTSARCLGDLQQHPHGDGELVDPVVPSGRLRIDRQLHRQRPAGGGELTWARTRTPPADAAATGEQRFPNS